MRREPGKHLRQRVTLVEAFQKFDTEAKAGAWFIAQCWPDGIVCPHCDGDTASLFKWRYCTNRRD